MGKSYLIDITKGNFKAEDRLSLILSTTFNNSKLFKKIFIDFLKNDFKNKKEKEFSGYLNSLRNLSLNDIYQLNTQDQKFESNPELDNSRLDIEIKDKYDRTFIAIENKLESRLIISENNKVDQLEKYQKYFKNAIKICFVKHNNLGQVYNNCWRIFYWSDLFFYIESFLQKNSNISEIDKFLINELKKYMKEYNYNFLSEINKNDVEAFGKFISTGAIILNEKKGYLNLKNLNVFETGKDLMDFCERIIIRYKEENRSINGLSGFQFNPKLGYLLVDKENSKELEPAIWIRGEVGGLTGKLKNKKIGIFGFGFIIKKDGLVSIESYVCDKDYNETGIYWRDITHKPKGDVYNFENIYTKSKDFWNKQFTL